MVLHVEIQITAAFHKMRLELERTDRNCPAESHRPVIFKAEDPTGFKTASLRCLVALSCRDPLETRFMDFANFGGVEWF